LTGSSVDFASNSFSITINAGEVVRYHNISITCDKLVEPDEIFNLIFSLANDNSQITENRSTAIVQITDSTGLLVLSHYYYCDNNILIMIIVTVNFSQLSYDVREDDGAVMIELIMNRKSSHPFEVVINMIDITATSMYICMSYT